MEPIFASVSSAQVGGGGTFRVPFAGSRFMLHKGAWRMPNVLWGWRNSVCLMRSRQGECRSGSRFSNGIRIPRGVVNAGRLFPFGLRSCMTFDTDSDVVMYFFFGVLRDVGERGPPATTCQWFVAATFFPSSSPDETLLV